jgi:hypothetical protein
MSQKRNPDSELIVSSGAAAPASSRRKSPSKARAKHLAASTESAVEVPEVAAAQAAQTVVMEQPVYEPSYEEIAQLAYLYWEARGCQGGSSEQDWLRAEQELRVRSRAATA